MTTSRVATSHTIKYEVTHFARYSLVWFCDLWRISSDGLAQAFMEATLILSLRLRTAEAGHLAVIHQSLPGGKAVPLQYICSFQSREIMRITQSLRIPCVKKFFFPFLDYFIDVCRVRLPVKKNETMLLRYSLK